MWVLTIDQQGSRRVGDRVEGLLDLLGDYVADPERAPHLVLPFERTVGDEVQAVVGTSGLAVELALHVLRIGGWSVGIGAGEVDRPLPASSRAGSGDAFVQAREAVEAAKSRMRAVPIAVRGADPAPAAEAEAVLALLGAIAARRSTAGWAVIDLLSAQDQPLRQEDVADRLGITQQAVSQRLRTALWAEEVAARPAAARLLALAAASDEDRGRTTTSDATRPEPRPTPITARPDAGPGIPTMENP